MTAPLTVFIKASWTKPSKFSSLKQNCHLLPLAITKTALQLLKSSKMLKKGEQYFCTCKLSKMLNVHLVVKKPHNHFSSHQL